MQQRLHRRLLQLEQIGANARAQLALGDREADTEKTIRRVKLFLQLRGIEQTPMESLMDAFARALEISPRELRSLLIAEIDPINKYFTDHGVFEEIERRKAAGTWPDGEGKTKNVRA